MLVKILLLRLAECALAICLKAKQWIVRGDKGDLTESLGHGLPESVRVARSGVQHISLLALEEVDQRNAIYLTMMANEGVVAAKEHIIWKRWKKADPKPEA